MRRTSFIVAGTVALVVGIAAGSRAATPSSIAVSPTSTSAAWTGASFLAGATASPTACPPAIDSTNTLCDHVSLDAGVTGAYWGDHTGGVRITISWADPADNFDLYVYNEAGTQVGSSATTGTASESVLLANAAGTYEIRVVPVLVTASGYSGTAVFSSQAAPTPSPSPSSGGTGTSGGGSGTGGGGSGSGSGTGGTGTGLTAPAPHYAFGSYGGASGGGLYYAPWSGNYGGTTYFGSGSGTAASGHVYYASAYGGQVSGAVADQVAKDGGAKPVSSIIARNAILFWILVVTGLAILAAVTYLIVEPEGESGGRVVAIGQTRARLPVPPLAVAGVFVRTLAAVGRHVAGPARRLLRRGHPS